MSIISLKTATLPLCCGDIYCSKATLLLKVMGQCFQQVSVTLNLFNAFWCNLWIKIKKNWKTGEHDLGMQQYGSGE